MIAGLYQIFNHWHEEGTVWIYSDPHFGDQDLEYNIHNRPSNEEHIKMINSKCGRKDTLIILGDIGDIECVQKLRAKRKVLIMGNHDAGRSNYERKIFTKIFDKKYYTKNEAFSAMATLYPGWRITISDGRQFHSPFAYWEVKVDNMLFDEVYEGPLMIAEKLILSHEPVNIPWAFNSHGHVHNPKHKNNNHHFNVCSDVIGYVPINFNQWMKSGYLSKIETIHRDTIDKATARARKRNQKEGKRLCK